MVTEAGQVRTVNAPVYPELDLLTADARAVARAMALLWTYRPRTACVELLRALGWKSSSGRAFTPEGVKAGQRELGERGLLLEHAVRRDYMRLVDPVRRTAYRELLDETVADTLREALWRAEKYVPGKLTYSGWPLWDPGTTVAVEIGRAHV